MTARFRATTVDGMEKRTVNLNCGHRRRIIVGTFEDDYAKEYGTVECRKCHDYSAIIGWTETDSDERTER